MYNPEGLWDTSNYLASMLPIIIVALPLIGSLGVVVAVKFKDTLRDVIVLAVSALTVLLVAALYPLLVQGPIRYTLVLIQGFDFILKVDYLSFLLALLFSLIWFIVALFGIYFFAGTHAKTRFYVFYLSTLGHVLGVVMAGDLFSFFLFFELMTFSSFVLLIHNQTRKALQAGIIYIFMGVIGGLSLLMAIFLIYHSMGTLEMVPMLEGLLAAGANVPLIVFLFLIGFGIKMGMVPLHIWMPKVYEAAPSPVNALSSAAMIKVGAYGLIRVLLLVAAPASISPAGETVINSLGLTIIWLGIITMLTGAVMALLQEHGHRILACSSISQMGYILMGIGTAAYLGVNGAMGYTGAVYHMINHAAIKGGLFLVMGALYMYTRDLNTSHLLGIGRKTPYLMVIFILAVLGIGGIPGFNGYISKTLLHHALEKAYQLHYDPALWAAEKLFILASALTVCYFLKLSLVLFAGKSSTEHKGAFKIPFFVKALLAVFGFAFVTIGLSPNIIYNGVILPSLRNFAFDPVNVAYYLEGINFFTFADLKSSAIVLVLAALIYIGGTRPRMMNVETIFYLPVVRLATLIVCKSGAYFDRKLNYLFDAMGRTTINACKYVSVLERPADYSKEEPGHLRTTTEEGCEAGEEKVNRKSKERVWLGRFKWTPEDFNIKNLNFDTLLLAFMLAIFLMVLVYLSAFQ